MNCSSRISWAVLVVAGLFSAQANLFTQQQEDQQQQPRADAFMQYEALKKDPWGPAALNFFLGFGIGSFVQGETTTGLILVGGSVVGVGLVIVGAVTAADAVKSGDVSGGSGGVMMIAGYGLLVASQIYGAIAPFIHANSFNEKLRRDLGISITEVSLIAPDEKGEYGVRVTATMEF